MGDQPLDIPSNWELIDPELLTGTLLVIGAPNVGKTTFARHLYQRLCQTWDRVAFLDGDPGQSILSPPTMMTLALGERGEDAFPPQGQFWRSFVGAVSPRGHMLPMVVGAARLLRAASDAGTQVIVYDTSGLIDAAQGGMYLKLAKIDMIRPTVVFAIQYDLELKSLLEPLRRRRTVEVIQLRPSTGAKQRSFLTRQGHRAAQFARYFSGAHLLTVNWVRLAVFPAPSFVVNRLVALEDESGFALGLGIVQRIDRQFRQVVLYTPVTSLDRVDAIRMGDVVLDPQTFRDEPINARGFHHRS
ncbi:MAG: hypothetical protein JSU72_06035 [Deltaproteobacteria bacterium]|nr:MAG: hypothetical protein JSU72_06035 [Deltaproteobacteria bacterium]